MGSDPVGTVSFGGYTVRFSKLFRQALVPVLTGSLVGCGIVPKKEFCAPPTCPTTPASISGLDSYLKLEDPCLADCFEDDPSLLESAPGDVDLSNLRAITLEECVGLALQQTTVLRDLGGSVLRSPQQIDSIHQPAMVYADPRFGEEAALSAFDASLTARSMWDAYDRVYNNTFVGNNGILQQDLGDYQVGVAKRSATGTLFGVRSLTNYDFNNSIANRYGSPSSSWDTAMQAEVRQPLLQGAGTEFNRIAGPLSSPGNANGVLIARTNTDISLAQFEEGLRDFVSDVENAYWDLFFAYKDLEAKIDARDKAALVWNANLNNPDATRSQKTQAEEQYHRFQAEVINALHGRLTAGTQTNAGLSSGAFQARGGLRVAERRLRLMIGMAINDRQLLRPVEMPLEGDVAFDWVQARSESLALRPELRKQRWLVKRSELELIAAKNHLLPRLDALANYRFRGFGNSLFGGNAGFDPANGSADSSAVADLMSGDLQDWSLGLELEVPIGYRKAHAAVRNAELGLARQRAILREQERNVIHGLSAAIGELQRASEVRETVERNLLAAYEQLAAVTERVATNNEKIDVQLEAQRILVDAQIRYAQAQVEYMLAIKGVHFEKGTLLTYNNVLLTERDWVAKATLDSSLREALRGDARQDRMNYVIASGPAGSRQGTVVHESYDEIPIEMPSEMILDESSPSDVPMSVPAVPAPIPAAPVGPAAAVPFVAPSPVSIGQVPPLPATSPTQSPVLFRSPPPASPPVLPPPSGNGTFRTIGLSSSDAGTIRQVGNFEPSGAPGEISIVPLPSVNR